MGCGVSRFDQTVVVGGGASHWRPFSLIHKKNTPSIADDRLLLKPLPEDHREGEDNAKGGGGKVNSDEIVEEDGQQSLPQSLSFRVYCTSSSLEDDNNSQGDSIAENMTDKQEGDVVEHQKRRERDVDHHKKQDGDGKSNKGSSTHRMGIRARIGKGIKSFLRTS